MYTGTPTLGQSSASAPMWSLVRVGDDDADEIALDLLHEGKVGHHEIDARRFVPGEGEAEIDHQPFSPTGRPEAVKRAVHSDFAQAAKGCEHELRVVLHLQSNFLRRRRSGLRPQKGNVSGFDRFYRVLPT